MTGQLKELERLIKIADSINDPDIKREFLDDILGRLKGHYPGKVIEALTFPAGRGRIASFSVVKTEETKKKLRSRNAHRVCIFRVRAKHKGQDDVSLVRWRDKEHKWRNTVYPVNVSISNEDMLNMWAALTIQIYHGKVPWRLMHHNGKERVIALIAQKYRLEKAVSKAV